MSDLENPEFYFISSYPEIIRNTPPLASSIQHFEACLMLIGYKRFPNALLSCVSAIESAFKAAKIEEKYLGKRNSGEKEAQATLLQCLDFAQKKFPQFSKIEKNDLYRFKEKRNQITHYGYSTKDDQVSFELLATIGLKYLEQFYISYFGFSFLANVPKAGLLDEPFRSLLASGLDAVSAAKGDTLSSKVLFPLAYAVNRHFNQIESWRLDVEESNQDEIWDAKENIKKFLAKKMDPSFEFDCPVCGSSETFIAKLNESKLGDAIVNLESGMCFECNFNSSNTDILNRILAKEISTKKSLILNEYGIKGD